jgi:hypothetical protein
MIVSSILGLLAIEALSRVLVPIAPAARLMTMDGALLDLPEGASSLRLPPGMKFRQVASEYDAVVTTSNLGYRGPPVRGEPKIIFLGDSFTFGTGLEDEQTFAYQYCHARQIDCVNLGRGGTSTTRQLVILESFLTKEGWRPREVRLFMLVMTAALGAGNDLADNLAELEGALEEPQQDAVNTGVWHRVVDYRRGILAWSNLIRVIYFVWGPVMRAKLSPTPQPDRLRAALGETARQLARFKDMAQKYHFDARIYIIHPVQDLLNGTYPQTIEVIRAIAPAGMSVASTAEALLADPSSYYYPYDGHFNPSGSSRIADFLLTEDEDNQN